MGEYSEAFVGIDVAKGRNAIAIADGERGGEVRYLGEVDASPPRSHPLSIERATTVAPTEFNDRISKYRFLGPASSGGATNRARCEGAPLPILNSDGQNWGDFGR